VIYDLDLQFSRGFSRSLTLQEVIVIICEYLRSQPQNLKLKRVRGKGMSGTTLNGNVTGEEKIF